MPDDEPEAAPDSVFDAYEELETVTCVVLVMVEVRTMLDVEDPAAELDEAVMAPAGLLPDAELLLA
jgi:hypothetical protein